MEATELNISFSPSAINKIQKLRSQGSGLYVHLRVEAGGCAGMQYFFSLREAEDSSQDHRVPCEGGGDFLVDKLSMPFLEGCIIDYVEEMIGSSFYVKNPQAVNACSCGSSFSPF